ncbi:hypothetical protein SUGI_0353500 [Cryptomeria japonica]|uniref:protein RADIALIS-like 3 n=1 Tax=Cryptomeria japonica TaxID=3369 RepID=UPI002408A51F|nr:protein RADIALIS-like 3 [Cryptomeria japonica]GLJ19562.1 hypothetical protein SUGI_0353500 [Cryptomeria japonica]
MASKGSPSGRNSASTWTTAQNKMFEKAIAIYDKDTPTRWQNVAAMVGGKSPDEVKRHYEILLDDLNCIEAGQVPFPNYKSSSSSNGEASGGGNSGNWGDKENRKFMLMKLQ